LIFVCNTNELNEGECKSFSIDNSRYLLSKLDNRYYAIEDLCTHDGETLSGGRLLGQEISCPRHGALFDVTTGEVRSLPALYDVKSFQVIEKDSSLFIEIED
tara:strand:+ start:10622 stop:10927 length:306 start_codon:yes stop_codon:yes gene_type:complete